MSEKVIGRHRHVEERTQQSGQMLPGILEEGSVSKARALLIHFGKVSIAVNIQQFIFNGKRHYI